MQIQNTTDDKLHEVDIISVVSAGSQSKRRQTKTAKVKTATCLNGDKRHGHNGDKLKRRNPKQRQEMVGLCEAFNFQSVISCMQYIIIAVQSILNTFLK